MSTLPAIILTALSATGKTEIPHSKRDEKFVPPNLGPFSPLWKDVDASCVRGTSLNSSECFSAHATLPDVERVGRGGTMPCPCPSHLISPQPRVDICAGALYLSRPSE